MTTFPCPRCHEPVDEAYYGPCLACRTALRAHYAGLARAVEEQKFEPALHVTPNQVATKD